MITAIHNMIFAEDAVRTRVFLRDTLKLPHVDAGGGWLIFALSPAELGVHPIEDGARPHHQMYLMGDDIHATISDLKQRGLEFTDEVSDQGWSLATTLRIPGGGEMALYQPRHASPLKPGK
jgi:hypothetical protein